MDHHHELDLKNGTITETCRCSLIYRSSNKAARLPSFTPSSFPCSYEVH